MRTLARHTVLRSVAVWLLLTSLTACRWDHIWAGIEYRTGSNENYIGLAAPAPHCGCLSIQNTYGVDSDGDGRIIGDEALPIVVQATFHRQLRGQILLRPGEPLRERFDWGGPFSDDDYHLNAFRIELDQNRNPVTGSDGDYIIPDEGELPIREALAMSREDRVRFNYCDELTCQFGSLRLDSGVNYQTIWAGIEIHAGRDWIDVAAPDPDCGCLTMANTSAQDIEIRATLFTAPIGSTILPPGGQTRVRFDWAGPLAEDRYRIQAFASGATWNATPLPIGVLELLHLPPIFMSCQRLACDVGDLNLNQAVDADDYDSRDAERDASASRNRATGMDAGTEPEPTGTGDPAEPPR